MEERQKVSVNESESRGGLTNWPQQPGKGSSNNRAHHCFCTDQIIELYPAEGQNSPAGEMLLSSGPC